nr:hypothetical protein [Nitrosopumilus sp.]
IRVKLGNWLSNILRDELLYSSKVRFERRTSVVTEIDSGASSDTDNLGDIKDRLSYLIQSDGYSNVNPRFGLSYIIDSFIPFSPSI